jgi:single-stranded-DNA-specific exonuclease
VENCLHKYPATLLLAVDCGSTAVASIAWLRERGVDAIVLDHHQVSSPPPAAVALVNPQLAGEQEVSFRDLCSAGLAFKLAHALGKRGRETGLPGMAEFDLRPLLDLVALGTIADVVPLTGENRIFVTAGLERLNITQRPGLIALKQIAQSPEKLGTMDVGYQLAPRLNAAGRLENALESLQLVLARNLAEALPLARNLDYHNQERQKIERGITTSVIGAVKARFNPQTDYVIVEGQLLWHIGVVGIVASRVLHQFYRPTFILGGEGEQWRGSGRSIPGFDLAAALRECDDLLVRHGGHAMAAGVTIAPDNLDAFRRRLNEIARRSLKPEDLQPLLNLDAEVTLRELTLDLLAELDRIRPTGQGNPPLQFWTRRLANTRPPQRMGAEKQHAKLWVTDGKTTLEAVWWGVGSATLPDGIFDLAFAPQINDFSGRSTVQLKVLDWRPTA